MTGHEPKKPPRGATVVAVAALVAVAYVATRKDPEGTNVPPAAVGWHGAMELYRNLALWAGKHAMHAELNYWKAVG